MLDDWRIKPTIIEYWPDDTDVIMGIDENGTAEIKSILPKVRAGKEISDNDKYFTLTGVSFNKNGHSRLKDKMLSIKNKYWTDGLYPYKGQMKRVCFHSADIRNKRTPFYGIDFNAFIADINEMISEMPTKVISCFFNKEDHCKKYSTPTHPYDLAMVFLLERFCGQLNEYNKKGAVIIEGRGKPEDKAMLKHILKIIEEGTNQNPPSHFRNITGVYFNPKWSTLDNGKKSFVILELADLMSYPIHKYHRNNCKEKDIPYTIVEQKLLKYPQPYGWGLKRWP